jgi:hypothetical protein
MSERGLLGDLLNEPGFRTKRGRNVRTPAIGPAVAFRVCRQELPTPVKLVAKDRRALPQESLRTTIPMLKQAAKLVHELFGVQPNPLRVLAYPTSRVDARGPSREIVFLERHPDLGAHFCFLIKLRKRNVAPFAVGPQHPAKRVPFKSHHAIPLRRSGIAPNSHWCCHVRPCSLRSSRSVVYFRLKDEAPTIDAGCSLASG